ncbi:hypothetical protein LOTGIDRAFT_162041 [Lottia gigantea]|uniref:Uncharacterized protein n=1 Tax=Lottia gigantea TaxID=225164 RepID=V4AHZ0_LOTGI|nr:hypothetical protein LOTGIDRAFT_162041 [Lottia gigantea]ESO93016.1 hypothetical protein LOTGIDRAFT_162041 [Lottia gigantea]
MKNLTLLASKCSLQLSIWEKALYRWLNHSESGIPSPAKAPKRSRKVLKTTGVQHDQARDFLQSLCKLPSHYCRSSTSKSYLEPIFVSFEDLYRIYKDHCLSNAGTAPCKKAFHSVFDELNSALFRPKKDQCDVCCAFENQNLTKDVSDNHIQRKADARLSKVQDKLVAENDESVKVLTMDLQAVLSSPRLQASAMYYKTKLACHNFTIYDLATKRCNMLLLA